MGRTDGRREGRSDLALEKGEGRREKRGWKDREERGRARDFRSEKRVYRSVCMVNVTVVGVVVVKVRSGSFVLACYTC